MGMFYTGITPDFACYDGPTFIDLMETSHLYGMLPIGIYRFYSPVEVLFLPLDGQNLKTFGQMLRV